MEMAYAGLDVGTSSCKMVVYDREGKVLFKAARKYKETGSNGIRELRPEAVMEGVKEVLKETGMNCREEIKAMAVTSLGESIICLDRMGNSLYPSMVTGDKRGIREVEELRRKASPEGVFAVTGLPPSEMYGLPKYMWMNENTKAIKEAQYIFFYEDYVNYYLTGKRMVSYSSASRSMAFDIHKKVWSEELLYFAGIRKEQMSEPAASGEIIGKILPHIAEELHLNPEMTVTAGGHDQNCAALGSGLSQPNVAECGMGTCEFMFLMLPEAVQVTYMIENDLTCVPYVFPGTYLTSLEITTCGILKNWARDTILKGKDRECDGQDMDFWNTIDDTIAHMRTDVLVLPQFGSSGNPDINYDVKGTITGLTVHTRPEEIYRAILEGMAFQMYLAYERAEKLGVHIDRMIATGGGAASDVTLQIRADVFNMEVATIASEESGTLGCMLLAAVAMKEYASIKEGIEKAVKVKKVFSPNREMQGYYKNKYEKFKKLYDTMHLFG